MARYLSVIEDPYRATIEEQDDTGIWFTEAIRAAGAEVGVLLRGDAVNYAVRGQDARGLRVGVAGVPVAPDLERDLRDLAARQVPVFVVAEDLAERGLGPGDLVPGLEATPRAQLARLIASYDRVLSW